MKRFKPIAVGCLILAFALSGGCLRAVRTGAADAINGVVSDALTAVLTQALGPITGGQ